MTALRAKGLWALVLALVAVVGAACGAAATPTPTPQATSDEGSSASAPPAAPAQTVSVGYNEGQMIPDFSIQLTDGRTVTRDQLLAQGRPAFLFFYATW